VTDFSGTGSSSEILNNFSSLGDSTRAQVL